MTSPIRGRYVLIFLDLDDLPDTSHVEGPRLESEIQWWKSMEADPGDWTILINRPDLKVALFESSHMIISGFDYE